MNRGPTSFFLVGRSGAVTWKRAGSSWWLFFVSHWYTSPSPRRSSGRRGLLVSGGRARFAGAWASLCLALVALLLLIHAYIASCSRLLSWMLDVRGDGACLVQNQLPTVRAALRPHYTNISLALRLQLRLLAARKQTSDTTPPLASVFTAASSICTSPPKFLAGVLRSRRLAARGVAPRGNSQTGPASRNAPRQRPQNARGAAPRRRRSAPQFHTSTGRSKPRGRSAAKANQ